ncbi:hypothetical protein CSC13_2101 [Klebsiella pneumoniae]|nr:hypothetical protein CSC13_2101 [Klebsiella pneumoniae]
MTCRAVHLGRAAFFFCQVSLLPAATPSEQKMNSYIGHKYDTGVNFAH